MIPFLIVDEASESHQCLLHLLVAVEPVLLARPDVRNPAVSQFLGRVVQAQILAIGERVVIDGRLDEVSGDVPFVVAAMIGRPSFRPGLAIGQDICSLQIAVRHLCRQNDRNPALQGRAHQLLRLR